MLWKPAPAPLQTCLRSTVFAALFAAEWTDMKYVLGILVLTAGAALVLTFWFAMLIFLATVLGIGFLAWAVGMKIKVARNGVPVGYYRWTKFYPYKPYR